MKEIGCKKMKKSQSRPDRLNTKIKPVNYSFTGFCVFSEMGGTTGSGTKPVEQNN